MEGVLTKPDGTYKGILMRADAVSKAVEVHRNKLVQQAPQMSAMDAKQRKKYFESLANATMAKVLFNSSAISSDSMIMAQRTFTNTKGGMFKGGKAIESDCPSQVWAGYLSRKVNFEGDCIVIDVGTGEMKFFAATKLQNGFVTGKEITKVTSVEFLQDIADLVVSMDLMWCAENEKKDRTGKDDAKLIQICNALQVSIEQGQKSFVDKASAIGATKAYAEQVFIFGTEGMRAWRRNMEPKHGGRCTELLRAISEFCSRSFDYDVEFEVISHEEEARCEFAAYKLVQKFASDFPEQYRNATLGNLGWARGSTQGVLDGNDRHVIRNANSSKQDEDEDEEDDQGIVCMPVGLKIVAGELEFARKVKRDFADGSNMELIMEELEEFLKQQIATHCPLINTGLDTDESPGHVSTA